MNETTVRPTQNTDGAATPDVDPTPSTHPRTTSGAAIPELTDVEKLQKLADEHLAGWQRAKADYLNLKRQSEKEKEELAKFANAALIIELLPIYDNLKRALSHVPDADKDTDWVKGIFHIIQQFKQLFGSLGIEEIKTVGEPFDHELHHAISKEKREGAKPGTVIEEMKTGFTMHGKLVEPAQVRVAE